MGVLEAMMHLHAKAAACAVILLIAAGPALGQAGRGTARLGGNVLDEDGKPIQGAKIKAVFDQPGGTTLETTSDKKGAWAFMGMGTGNWIVSAGISTASIGLARSSVRSRSP